MTVRKSESHLAQVTRDARRKMRKLFSFVHVDGMQINRLYFFLRDPERDINDHEMRELIPRRNPLPLSFSSLP